MEVLTFITLVAICGGILWNVSEIRAKMSRLVDGRSATVSSAELKSLIDAELQRARRFNYPLALISLRSDATSVGGASLAAVLNLIASDSRYPGREDEAPGVVNIFRNSQKPVVTLRSTDLAVFDRQKRQFVMILVGTASEDAHRIASHITRKLSDRLGSVWTYGCAAFPSDDLIVEDLLERAYNDRKAAVEEAGAKEAGLVAG